MPAKRPRPDPANRSLRLDGATRRLLRMAVREDVGSGDVTTRALVAPGTRVRGYLVAKETGVCCGLPVAREIFRLVAPRGEDVLPCPRCRAHIPRPAPRTRFTPLVREGRAIRPGDKLARIEGGRDALTAERVALNFLQRLCGIATLTKAYARRLRGTRARLYDTRKTLPGWRALDKYAVRCGGGFNHRMGLYDAVMLKDNHWTLNAPQGDGARKLETKLWALRRRGKPGIQIIIEAKNRAQVRRALRCGADILLLDNMPLPRLRREIRFIRANAPKTQIEVSGGVHLGNIRKIARLGPNRISVGRITHSAPALDISLEIAGLSS